MNRAIAHRTLVSVAAAAAMTGLAACGGASGAQSSTGASLRAGLRTQRPQIEAIATDLRATLRSAGPRPDALMADGFSALAARAQHEAQTVEGLAHPPADNTRLRDLGSALLAVANGLGHLSTAATEHQTGTAAAQMRALRGDAVALGATERQVALALGLHG